MGANRKLFALDQNFPLPIINLLEPYMPEAELVPIQTIDNRMVHLDDWQVLLALYAHEADWDGMITADANMLGLPRELAVLLQTRLTLVVAEAAGDDPLKASGMIILHLPGICKLTDSMTPQVWRLRSPRSKPLKPWKLLEDVASRQDLTAPVLYDQWKLSETELTDDPIA